MEVALEDAKVFFEALSASIIPVHVPEAVAGPRFYNHNKLIQEAKKIIFTVIISGATVLDPPLGLAVSTTTLEYEVIWLFKAVVTPFDAVVKVASGVVLS